MTETRKPSLPLALWRWFSGAHLDGRIYTNATWTKGGTHPRARLTWWNSRPRLFRAAVRTLSILLPVLWLNLFVWFHYWTVVVSVGIAPYVIHNAWWIVFKATQRSVRIPEHVNPETAEASNIIAELTFTEEDASPTPKRKAR